MVVVVVVVLGHLHWQTGLGLLEKRGVNKNARKRRKDSLTQAAAATLTYHASYRSFLNGIRLIAQTTSRHRLAKAFISQDWGGGGRNVSIVEKIFTWVGLLGGGGEGGPHTQPPGTRRSRPIWGAMGQEMPFLSFGD